MRYTEEQLKLFTKPLSETEKESCERALRMIKDVFKKHNFIESSSQFLNREDGISTTLLLGENLQIGYFEQEVKGDNRTTCIEEIWQEFPSFTQYEVRSALAKCGLTTKHIESQVRVLSGGEQAKVRLCKLVNRDTNILLLDEPTNHLDVDAKDSLKKALLDYRGSVLLICHEPEFYQDVVHAVWDCSKWTTKQI